MASFLKIYGGKSPPHVIMSVKLCRRLYSCSLYTVRKVLADLAVFDWWRYCKALCDVKFLQIEGNGRKFSHRELHFLRVWVLPFLSRFLVGNYACWLPQIIFPQGHVRGIFYKINWLTVLVIRTTTRTEAAIDCNRRLKINSQF